MNMKNKDAAIRHLSLLRDRLRSLDETDSKSQSRIVGIDLYEYIQSIPRLQQIWKDHIGYMHELSHDEDYMSLENLLWEAAERLAQVGVRMCDAGISDPVRYKNPFAASSDQSQGLALRDVLSLYLDKKNRISISDFEKREKALGFLQTETNDHFRRKIVQQYADLFPIVWFNKSIRDNQPERYSEDFPTLLIILKDYLKTLEDYLIVQPVHLALESFERVQSIADSYTHNHQESTFPLTVTRIILNSSERPQKPDTNAVSAKEAAIEVCDKLIWAIAKDSSIRQTQKSEPIWVRCMDFEICHEPLALRKGEMCFREQMEGKCDREEDKERRKALRVIAAFSPVMGSPMARTYENREALAKALKISADSLPSQLSVARKFLKDMVKSAFTISDARGQRRLMLEPR